MEKGRAGLEFVEITLVQNASRCMHIHVHIYTVHVRYSVCTCLPCEQGMTV